MKNLTGIFFSPFKTFREISARSSYLPPIAAASLLKLLYMFVFFSPSLEPLKILVTYLLALLPLLLPITLCSAVFFVVLLIAGKNPHFSKVFSVFAHTFFAYTAITVILGILIYFVAPDSNLINPQSPMVSNLGILVSPRDSLVLNFLLGSIDLIVFYHLFLIVVGISIVIPKTSIKSSLIITVSLWLTYILFGTLIKILVSP